MAGSLVWRAYQDDVNIFYRFLIDKSNASAGPSGHTEGDSLDFCRIPTANYPILPKTIKKRYVLAFCLSNPKIKRKFYIGNRDVVGFLVGSYSYLGVRTYPGANDTAGTAQTWISTYYSGEKRILLPLYSQSVDTGLTN
jgi:hypothetical protein